MADIGGRWLLCGGGWWLWIVAVDLQCGLLWVVVVVVDDNGGEDNILF